MKRLILLGLACVFAVCGLGLLISAVAPFVQDFADLTTRKDALIGRMFRLMAGIACGVMVRLLLQIQAKP